MANDPMQQAWALVEKWRAADAWNCAGLGAAASKRECADELAAILATPSESASVGEDSVMYAVMYADDGCGSTLSDWLTDCNLAIDERIDFCRRIARAAIDAARALPGDGKEG